MDCLTARIADSVDDVSHWMNANRQQLNIAKTDLLLRTTNSRELNRLQTSLPVGNLLAY
jgi:hypothetical protein